MGSITERAEENAVLDSIWQNRIISGTSTIPPPAPKRPQITPAEKPINRRRTGE